MFQDQCIFGKKLLPERKDCGILQQRQRFAFDQAVFRDRPAGRLFYPIELEIIVRIIRSIGTSGTRNAGCPPIEKYMGSAAGFLIW